MHSYLVIGEIALIRSFFTMRVNIHHLLQQARTFYGIRMLIDFLTDEQYQSYAKYPTILTQDQLDKYFYVDDKDKELIDTCRRDYNKLGYAL